jgi:hypothetical protein
MSPMAVFSLREDRLCMVSKFPARRSRQREDPSESFSADQGDPSRSTVQNEELAFRARAMALSGPATSGNLLQLQQLVGNNTVTAMLYRSAGLTRTNQPSHSSVQRQEQGESSQQVAHPVLKQGSSGPSVTDAQAKLNRVGADPPLAEDGIFGPKTRAAVVSFQSERGLLVDGVIGPQTWGALDANNVVPKPDDPLACGCEVEDEDADVFELTPDAVRDQGSEPLPVQLLMNNELDGAVVQRDDKPNVKKKKPPTPVPGKCSNDARACFSISGKRAWLLKPGKVVEIDVPALGGRKGHPTPQGKFKVVAKDADHHSSIYKDPKTGKPAPMPNYVNFAPAVGFHAGSLAVESHGCVHLSPAGAKIFFDGLKVGDRVDVVP